MTVSGELKNKISITMQNLGLISVMCIVIRHAIILYLGSANYYYYYYYYYYHHYYHHHHLK